MGMVHGMCGTRAESAIIHVLGMDLVDVTICHNLSQTKIFISQICTGRP